MSLPYLLSPEDDHQRTRAMLRSLRGWDCPACSRPKRSGVTLCRECYRRLPVGLKRALYRPARRGYEEAVEAALAHLGGASGKGAPPCQ